jgi:putative Mg2+ transporter-C (MgtC) family protein
MIETISDSYFLGGDLFARLEPPWAGVVLILTSILCGTLVGLERESKDKPAGLRTVSLICVGSTIFTFASKMIVVDSGADPGRIAAQIVTGIGFLGAGAIIRERGTVVGMTTGATIWTVAAIGVIVGMGYAIAGLALTLVVVGMLTFVRRFERKVFGDCRYTTCRVLYHTGHGKTRLRLLRILDKYHIPDHAWTISAQDDREVLDIRYCNSHRGHRAFLFEMIEVHDVVEFLNQPIASHVDGGIDRD